MTSVRKKIAEHLSRSWRELPHVTTYAEADATAMLEARVAAGKPPLEALLMKAIGPLLVEYPSFNASIDGDVVVEKLHYDIGFAVSTPDGLMVAVVRDVLDRSVDDLAAEISRLAAATKDRKASASELRGQTFTISNIGAVGGRFGTPLVRYGTTAILGVGRADETPVVRDGEIVIGREFPLSLFYDHRAIDGATGRAFMGALVGALESAVQGVPFIAGVSALSRKFVLISEASAFVTRTHNAGAVETASRRRPPLGVTTRGVEGR